MKYTTITKFINEYKNALRQRRRTLTFKYTKQNINFTKYLLEKGFLNSYTKWAFGKKKVIILSLRFSSFSQSSMSQLSVLSRKTHTRELTNIKLKDFESNFIVKLALNNKKLTEIKARFR